MKEKDAYICAKQARALFEEGESGWYGKIGYVHSFVKNPKDECEECKIRREK